ncbi:hypothetical protein TNIN_175901 [Trichonephila inaurata madagascariensis]|uniref:Uncharacterized protein n=1 Tax=Trichonephila inaurata madagascariensis TaxID=2747483 RepID=A0A8X6Y1X1_9ARAC|nr:hypothetical protein TNIN_175901 [Trichonephila inaurata madagascariensis]
MRFRSLSGTTLDDHFLILSERKIRSSTASQLITDYFGITARRIFPLQQFEGFSTIKLKSKVTGFMFTVNRIQRMIRFNRAKEYVDLTQDDW